MEGQDGTKDAATDQGSWWSYLAECHEGNRQFERRVARLAAEKAIALRLAGGGEIAGELMAPERGRSHEGPGQSREETPKVGMPLAGRRTGREARNGEDLRGRYAPAGWTGARPRTLVAGQQAAARAMRL